NRRPGLVVGRSVDKVLPAASLGVVRVLLPAPLLAAPRLPGPFLAPERAHGPAHRGREESRLGERRAMRHGCLLLVLVCGHRSASLCCSSRAAGPVSGLVVKCRDRAAPLG